LLLEVTPGPPAPLTDVQLLERVKAITAPMRVAILRDELKDARRRSGADEGERVVEFAGFGEWRMIPCEKAQTTFVLPDKQQGLVGHGVP